MQVTSETSQYFISSLYSFAKSQLYLQQVMERDSSTPDLSVLDQSMIWLTKAIRSMEVGLYTYVLEHIHYIWYHSFNGREIFQLL